MNSFSPNTRQESEREIVRIQKDFSAGVFDDIPASTIPDNGVAYLKNFINKGTELVGRSGCKKWGNYSTGTAHASLPNIATGITYTETTNPDSTERSLIISGYTVEDDDVGRWFIYSDGSLEEIVEVTVLSSIITTRRRDNVSKSGSTGKIRGRINGMYFHHYLKKIVVILDSTIYISSDVYMSSWNTAYCQSTIDLLNEPSTIDEKDNYLIIGNTNGIYRLDLDIGATSVYYYYRINSDVPSYTLDTQSQPSVAYIYARRYIYGLGRMTTASIIDNRASSGSILHIDSGTNKVSSSNIDYAVKWSLAQPDVAPITINNFQVPTLEGSATKDAHWDSYTIWGTTDCSEAGLTGTNGSATNTERYVWVNDIPIMKAILVDMDGDTGTVIDGDISIHDIGSQIYISSGSSTTVETILTVTENTDTFTITGSITGSSLTAQIGAQKASTMTYNSGTHIFTLTGTAYYLNVAEVGRRVFLSNGTKVYISQILSPTQFVTTDSPLIVGTVVGCWNYGTRSYYDNLSDEALRGRTVGYPCNQRFFDKLPNSDIINYSSGFLFAATRDDNYIYYSQVPDGFDYLMGYYHPAYQLTHIKDGIRDIRSQLDQIVVYGYNSTNVIALNTYTTVDFSEIGVFIAVVPNIVAADEIIGCVAYGSIQQIENGNHILITSEPALRIFDGKKYSENLASKKMMDKIKSLQTSMSSCYSSLTGYLFWGSDV